MRRASVRTLALLTAGAVAAVLSVVLSATLTHGPESNGLAGAASLASPFQVTGNAAIRRATGTPAPPSGTQASLWANGATATITLDGAGRLVIGGIADYCRDWPTVRVSADGRTLGDVKLISASQYGAYPVGTALTSGQHLIKISLINDVYDPPCDRNAHIGSAFLAPTQAPSPPAPIPTIGPTLAPSASSSPTSSPTKPPTSSPSSSTAPAPQPPATGRPGPDNTGVPAGTQLTVHEGDLTVSKDGSVIDRLDIRGFLKIQASNVTVRRSIIRGGYAPGPGFPSLVQAYGDHRNLVIEDSTLEAAHPSGYLDGLKGRNFTARRLDVSRTVDTAIVFGDNVTIEDSWFHDTAYFSPWPSSPDNQTHNDSLQIEGGTNIVVRNNVFEGAQNAAIMVTQNYSRTSNVKVSGNWLAGGRVCTVNLSEKGKGPIYGFALNGNRFGPKLGLNRCAVIAPPTTPVTTSGDYYVDTGQLVVVSKGV